MKKVKERDSVCMCVCVWYVRAREHVAVYDVIIAYAFVIDV